MLWKWGVFEELHFKRLFWVPKLKDASDAVNSYYASFSSLLKTRYYHLAIWESVNAVVSTEDLQRRCHEMSSVEKIGVVQDCTLTRRCDSNEQNAEVWVQGELST